MSENTTHETHVLPADNDQAPNGARHDDVLAAQPSAGTLARRAPADGTLAVTPQVKAGELVDRLDVIREAMHTAMTKDIDYGVIPGTDKPTLLKPGAEKLSVLFQLDVQLVNEKHWGPGDHLQVISRATVYHAPSGARLGCGEGTCSTRERKYAYRRQERTCPECEATAVIKGKKEYGGGWLCWRKRNGCGATFADGDQAIESQPVGEIENPDLPDLWNTIVKMAAKRARIDAVLAVTGASAIFSQDIEDQQQSDAPEPEQQQDPEHQQALTNGAQASDELKKMAFEALTRILGDRAAAKAVAERITNEDGHLCAAAARTLVYITIEQNRRQATHTSPDPQATPDDEAAMDAAAQGVQARMNAVAAHYREHDQAT